MKKLITEEEWLKKHEKDIQNINNMFVNLEKNKKIQKIYNSFLHNKNKKNKIFYNNEDNLLKFEKDILLTSYTKNKKIKSEDSKLEYNNIQMNLG